MQRLRPTMSFSLRDVIGDQPVVAFNIGPQGEAWVVLALEPLDYTIDTKAVFTKTVPESPQRYRVLVARDGRLEADILVEGERFNIHEVQPFGDGEFLLACLRSYYRGPDDFDLNGRVYARDGRFLRAVLLGDGLQVLQATRGGELWAAYSDEGVFGSYGCDDPVVAAGAAGLVAWSCHGEKLYDYEPSAGLEHISDCYVLNVATDGDTWCCYYEDFPIVHLKERNVVAWWASPVSGAHAMAVAQGHVLFAGDFDDRDALTLVHLEPEGLATVAARFELCGDDGVPLKAQRVVGRGGSLYLFSDGVVHEVSLDAVLDAVRRK